MTPRFTAEQLALVQRISASNNYYNVLCIKRNATTREIDQSYKKIALKLHPDKNHAPGAEEAFKTLRVAVEVLTNVVKRRNYDFDLQFEERRRFNRSFHDVNERSSHRSFDTRFESNDTDSDEDSDEEAEHRRRLIIICLLVLAAFLYALIYCSIYLFNKPIYSFLPSSTYRIMRRTPRLRVRYYVEENFEKIIYLDYQNFLETIGQAVEEDYVANLKFQCYHQKSCYQCFLYFVFNILLNLFYFINAIFKIFRNDDEFLI